MKKTIITTVLAGVMAISMSLSAFAGTWLSDPVGWWWQNNDGSYPSNCWMWIDGNNDGISECYYFNENGYCLMDTVTPDGYYVNATGAWIVDGAIQQQAASNTMTDPAGKEGSSGAIFTGKTEKVTHKSTASSNDDDDDDDDDDTTSSSSGKSSSSSKTLSLLEANPVSKSSWSTVSNVRTNQEDLWGNACRLSGKGAYAEFYTAGKYSKLSFTYAAEQNMDNKSVYQIEVYGDDDELLWTSNEIDYKSSAKSASIDVSGQDYVKIYLNRLDGTNRYVYLKNAQFTK